MSIRRGFTLVELAIVILILGIIATVAAPKVFFESEVATDSGLKQTLSTIRDAIEVFQMDNNYQLPGVDKNQDTFKADLQPYIRGEFPRNPVGGNPSKLDQIHMRDGGDPVVDHIDNDEGWIYDNVTGEFGMNNDNLSNDGVTYYHEF